MQFSPSLSFSFPSPPSKNKEQQEVTARPKNEVVSAHSNPCGNSKGDVSPKVSTVTSDLRTRGHAPCTACGKGRSELQGSPSPHTELSCVELEMDQGLHTTHTGSASAAEQTTMWAIQASRPPTHCMSLRTAMGSSSATPSWLPKLTSFHGAVCFQRHLSLRGQCLCHHPLQGLRGVWLPSQVQTSEATPCAPRPCPEKSCHPGLDLLSSAAHLCQGLHPACKERLHLQLPLHQACHPYQHIICRICPRDPSHPEKV